ncbi:PIG-L deacetylase family protein [Leucobacter triazinivorans]|uniref:PIG-L family deacetylase n=1 Tax=Leucobacter triazinivorans TaxID=1784719 RepID=A0A4P6KHG6_9MICO|nr:PIG-L deacetylase family protein [Leucobacter triazinivorans]QBE49975.1 PIG-L family deacetylase [Leucobacter triazinivorans]
MDAAAGSPSLEPLDDAGFRRVLVVVAHPDDPEYGTSAAVAEWTGRGVEVGYLLLTSGEAGMQRPPEEAAPLRAEEQRRACDEVGVQRLTILDFPDGMLEYGLELRRAIAREIRRFRPDVVVTGSGELLVPWGIDHADHRAAGLATIDAVRDADNRWVFPELLRDEDLGPWGATWMLLTGARPTSYVEIGDDAERRAIASLAAHEAYLADLPWHPAPADAIPEMLRAQGGAAGVPRAVGFSAHRLRGAE